MSVGLLEREEELERLGQLMAGAADGRGAAVVLEGPAGIGKTSLLQAALRLAGEARLGVLAARGGELERDFAYGVVRQLLERRLVGADAAERERWLDGAAALAAPLVGLGAEGRPGDDPTAAALHGLYWLTVNLAADGPLLVAVDDLHWVDSASLRFLAYLARRVAELPVLLLAATRPPLESHAPELVDALGADPGVLRMEPAPLSVAAVGRLVGVELAEACHTATGGNPFLVSALVEHPELDAGRLPEIGARSVIRSVAQRLGRLGADTEALARAVAVLGTDAEPRHAYALAELDERSGAAAEDALVVAGVLAARRPLEFVHPIVRAAVAEQLSPPERARRHLAAARMLDAEGGDAERIAPHLLAADARGDAWVVDTLRRAAARSVGRGAPDAAVRYLRRALDEPPAAEVRPALLAELGRAEVRAAMPDEAVEHLRAALASGSPPDLAHDLAIGLIAPGRYEEAVAMLEEAARRGRSGAPPPARGGAAVRGPARRPHAADRPPGLRAAAAGRLRRHAGRPDGARGGRPRAAAARWQRRGGAGARHERARRRPHRRADRRLGPGHGRGLRARDGRRLRARRPRAGSEALADVRRRGSVIGFARTSCMRALLRLQQGRLGTPRATRATPSRRRWEPGYRIARMAHAPLVEALVAQGELDAADAALAAAGLDGEIPDGYMLNFVLFARGALRLAQGRGAADLDELARREGKWRGRSPARVPVPLAARAARPARAG